MEDPVEPVALEQFVEEEFAVGSAGELLAAGRPEWHRQAG